MNRREDYLPLVALLLIVVCLFGACTVTSVAMYQLFQTLPTVMPPRAETLRPTSVSLAPPSTATPTPTARPTIPPKPEPQKSARTPQEAAEQFFIAFSVPSPETRGVWGMTDFHVFGRGALIIGLDGRPLHQVNESIVIHTASAPETYTVIIPFWCEGTRLNGEPVKLQRRLNLTIVENGGVWTVQDYTFGYDAALSFWDQIGSWVFWSIVGPLLAAAFVVLIILGVSGTALLNLEGCTKIFSIVYVVLAVVTLPLVGYYGWIFFGSIPAVVICIVAYTVASLLLSALLRALVNG